MPGEDKLPSTQGSDDPPQQRDPMSEAMEWVSRILAFGVVMVGPGALGFWLDQRWHTRFLALLGFALGFVVGIMYLLVVTTGADRSRRRTENRRQGKDSPS